MSAKKDLTGQRFGRLTVISQGENQQHHLTWICKCDCGKQVIALGCNLLGGKTKSCGCIRKEMLSNKQATHRLSKSSLYHIYYTMIARCCKPNSISYKDYGAKGIRVCDEWLKSFESFRDWAFENGYVNGLSIERKNVLGNYSPDNCTWIPRSKQNGNKRNTHYVTYKGEKMCLNYLAKETGLTRKIINRQAPKYNYDYDLMVKDYKNTHEKVLKGGKMTWQMKSNQQKTSRSRQQ
jgi:hypothetical protein